MPTPKSERAEQFILILITILLFGAFIPLTPGDGDGRSAGLNARRLTEIGMLILGSGGLGLFLLKKGKPQEFKSSPTFLIVSLFSSWALISALWSPSPIVTIAKSGELWLLAAGADLLVPYFRQYFKSKQAVSDIMAWIVSITVLLLFCQNILLHGDLFYKQGIDEDNPEYSRPRLHLGYLHALLGADLVSMGSFFILLSRMGWLYKVPLLGLFLITLIQADARGPTAGYLLVIILFFVVKVQRMDYRILGAMTVVTSLIWLYAFDPGIFFSKISGVADRGDTGSLNGRDVIWSFTLEKIMDQPLMGYSYAGSRFVLLDRFPHAGHAHNATLDIFLTTGIIGVSVYVLFVVYSAYLTYRSRDLQVAGMSLYCMMHGLLNPLHFVPGFAMFFLMLSYKQAELVAFDRDHSQLGKRNGQSHLPQSTPSFDGS